MARDDNDKTAQDDFAHPTVSPAGLNLAPQTSDPDDLPLELLRGDGDSDEDKTVLVLNSAFYVTSYVHPDKDGGTLVFDRLGTAVPSEDADQIVADAAANGVSLTRKAN